MSDWNGSCVLFLIIFGAVYAEYKLNIASLKKCNVSDSKMDKSVDLEFTLGMRKVNRQTTLITTNFTIGRKMGPMFISFRSYEMKQNGAKDLALVLDRISCKSLVAAQFIKVIKIKVDKDCFVYPGAYYIDNINLNDFAWIFTNSMVNLGRYSYEIEMLTDKGLFVCVYLVCDIVNKK